MNTNSQRKLWGTCEELNAVGYDDALPTASRRNGPDTSGRYGPGRAGARRSFPGPILFRGRGGESSRVALGRPWSCLVVEKKLGKGDERKEECIHRR